MNIIRSCKCYFSKWLTKKKKAEIKEIITECNKIQNYFVNSYENNIPELSKYNLTSATVIQKCIKDTETFLTARLIKQVFWNTYGIISAAKERANKQQEEYKTPKLPKSTVTLSECSSEFSLSKLKLFDSVLTLKSIRTDKKRGYKINIPIKKNKVFNKWNEIGALNKSVILCEDKVIFSFDITVENKKMAGELIGVDFGIKHLGTLSNGLTFGDKIEEHILQLENKKKYSKGYYRKKKEIRDYINKEIKKIDFQNTQLIVIEKLSKFKYKMKNKKKFSKKVRKVLNNLSTWQFYKRIKSLSEENRVCFRAVPAYNTSIMCSKCGHIEKGNRKTQEHFTCQKCGYTDNADLNASKNILNRFLTGMYGSRFKQVIEP